MNRRDLDRPPRPRRRWLPWAAALFGMGALAVVAARPVLARRHQRPIQQDSTVQVEPPGELARPALWIDVREPQKAREALRKNAWLQQTLQQPLGKGFVGSWGPFLGSRGEDLRAAFKGAVAEAVMVPLLSQPFRVAWLAGPEQLRSPVLVVPAPRDQARLAYAALDSTARRGDLSSRCPGASPSAQPLRMVRWLIGEHAVYAALAADRLALSRHPSALIHALCLPPADVNLPERGADVEVGFAPDRLGRGAQLGAALLGMGPAARLQLSVQGDKLVPAGIGGQLARPERLGAGAPNEELLEITPAGAPVVLTAQLNLPDLLDRDSLRAYWQGAASQPMAVRQVAVVWWPRGDGRHPEAALLWSRPSDRAALEKIFAGDNKLDTAMICGQLVLASGPKDMLERFDAACEGRAPSLKSAAPAAVEGLRRPSSVALAVQVGRALAQLAEDGYRSDAEAELSLRGAPVPKEPGPLPAALPAAVIEALRQLAELPFLGFTGTAGKRELIPGGFGT
jgi:hypothetical protein